jgi:septal ring factor EnvC (AmiA/AmiB activator)
LYGGDTIKQTVLKKRGIHMGLGDIFKTGQFKAEIEELKQENIRLQDELSHAQSLLTPEMQNAQKLHERIGKLNAQKSTLENNIKDIESDIAQRRSNIEQLDLEIKNREKQIIDLDDEILVQDFGLYRPHYNFANALDYKEKLAEIRSRQKALIKNKDAVTGNTNWQVNGSVSKGRKMVNDTQKLLLRAFNTECDELISKVKYTNYDASLNRIYKSAEAISKLGTIMDISIKHAYLNLKVEELRLAFEYQQKKQEEKEAQKAARAEMREAARLQKEIEAQRKKIEKEQTHYQTAYDRLMKQLEHSPDDEALLSKKAELENQLKDIDKAIKDIDYREANQRAGYVYVISNIGAFGPDVYKIGMTRRLDPQDRVDELGDASVPFNFDVHAMIFSDDAPALETALHKAFEDRKLNMVNTRREFFHVTLNEIKDVVKKNFDKTVEFIDVPDAEQYRISLKMQQEMN